METGSDLAACKACYCLAARSAARTITRLYEARLRPHGLRATQFSILAALALKGVTAVSELADLLGLERTTLTRSAILLERNGWLRPGRSEDAREHPLELTPAGRAKLEEAYPAWQEAQELVGRMLAEGGEGNPAMGLAAQAVDPHPFEFPQGRPNPLPLRAASGQASPGRWNSPAANFRSIEGVGTAMGPQSIENVRMNQERGKA